MNPQLTAEYDDALVGLEAFASLASSSWEEDPQQDHDAGSNAWLTRWLHHPLTLLRVFDSIYARATAALSEVSLEIALLRDRLARSTGRTADDEVLTRRAAELLCHEADLTTRVGRPAEERILAARTQTLEMLGRALKRGNLESARRAREASDGARSGEAASPMETYRRLAEEVRALAGVGNALGRPPDLTTQPSGAPARSTRTAESGISPAWLGAGSAGVPRSAANDPVPRRP